MMLMYLFSDLVIINLMLNKNKIKLHETVNTFVICGLFFVVYYCYLFKFLIKIDTK